MQQSHCSPASTGTALVCASMIAIATLGPVPDARLSPGAVVTDVVGLAAGAVSDNATLDAPGLLQALAASPLDPSTPAGMPADPEGLGELWPLFAPLVSLVQSTWLASVVLLQAFASLNPLQILSALFQFPLTVFLPPVVVIINYFINAGNAGAADPADATTAAIPDLLSHLTDGFNSMAAPPGLDDAVGQLSGLIAAPPDDLGAIPAALAADPGLDMVIP